MAKQKKSGSKSKKRKSAKRGGKLPKSYIKKYGSLKAAWKAFKSGKKLPKKKKAKKAKAKKAKKKHPKKSAARESKSTRSKAAKKGAKKAKKRKSKKGEGSLAAMIQKNKQAIESIEARYEARRNAYIAKMAKASTAERERLQVKMAKLNDERDKELARERDRRIRFEERFKQLEAAEKKRHKKHKRGRKKNPITGWGESASALAGVAVGGLSLVLVDALISNRGNLQNTGGVLSNQPAAGGGVYLLEAQSLPVWKQFKHAGGYRILWALTNIGGPLVAAHYLGKAGHKKWATFFDGWGYTDSGIAVAKLTTDGVAALFGKKAFAMKLVPAQLVALNATAAAQASNLPLAAAPIAAGTSGKLGYATTGAQSVLGAGKEPGCPHVGAGQACCNACSKGGAPGRPQPGQAGPPAQYPPGSSIPGRNNQVPATGLDNPPGNTTGNGATAPGGSVVGAQGAGRSNVVEIAHPAFRDRMPKKRSFDRRY